MSLLPDLSQLGPQEPVATSSLDFLRSVYADPGQPIHRRLRAAIAALPFEYPKLAVVASLKGGGDFAARLEAAIARSGKVIEYKPAIVTSEESSSAFGGVPTSRYKMSNK